MENTLQIRDKDGKFVGIPAISGKSAYQYAVEGGFKGTEEEFAQAVAELMPNTEHTENKDNPHGVTPAQIGALPATGGIVPNAVVGLGGGSGQVVGGHTYAAIESISKNNKNNSRMLRVINPDTEGYPTAKSAQLLVNTPTISYGIQYNLYGEHNKGKGTYTGNQGKYSLRIGGGDGIGKYLFIASSKGDFAIVSAYGARVWTHDSSATVFHSKENVSFIDGVLSIAESYAGINNYNDEYFWQIF